MELNLSGAHAPYFTRNVVVPEDSTGNLGLGEVPAAAIPGKMNGIDIRWIWQESREHLIKQPPRIVDGCIDLPRSPGRGIDVDLDQVKKAHALYLKHGLGTRNDTIGMQYLIPGWKFDNKKPCLVR